MAVRGGGDDLRSLGLVALRADGAEHSLLRAMVASILLAVAIYAVIIPSLARRFRARRWRAWCARPIAGRRKS